MEPSLHFLGLSTSSLKLFQDSTWLGLRNEQVAAWHKHDALIRAAIQSGYTPETQESIKEVEIGIQGRRQQIAERELHVLKNPVRG